MSFSNMFGKVTGAAVLVGGLTACGTTAPVNTTRYEAANSNQVVKIDRCADNGFHVAEANSYNMAQVQQNNRNSSRFNTPLNGLFVNTGVSSQLLNTANGSFIIQYPRSFQVNNEVFSKLAGAVVGGGIGSGYGRVVGAVFGVAVLAPIFESVSDKLTEPSRREKHVQLAECISDLYALNGGRGASRLSGPEFIGNPGPRPRY